MTPLLPSIDPRPLLALLIVACYAWRGRFAAWMVVDWLLFGLLIYQPTIPALVFVSALMLWRHAPWLAEETARGLHFDAYTGLTAATLWLLFPGARALMQSEDDGEEETQGVVLVHVPVPGTALVPGIPPVALNIRDEWIDKMAEARDEKGKFLYTSNDIFKANGGHRATVQARVRAIQQGAPPAQFRQSSGDTAPAHYPVTKDGQL